MEILMERNRDSYLGYFNIPKKAFLKRRILTTSIMLILYAAILTVTYNHWLLLAIPLVGFFGYKLPYLELLNQKNHS
ncbi:hypothetical protein D7X33_43510, partial [Butyricicoccus sp. 1XD8-22]